jgi:hypothetical protein
MINGWTTFATFYLDSGSHYMNWKDNVLETTGAIAFNLNGTSDINIDNTTVVDLLMRMTQVLL